MFSPSNSLLECRRRQVHREKSPEDYQEGIFVSMELRPERANPLGRRQSDLGPPSKPCPHRMEQPPRPARAATTTESLLPQARLLLCKFASLARPGLLEIHPLHL